MNKKRITAALQTELGTTDSLTPSAYVQAAVTVSIRSSNIRRLDDHSLQEDPELLSLAEDLRHGLSRHLRSPECVFPVVGEHGCYRFQVALDTAGSCLTDVLQVSDSLAGMFAMWRLKIESNARNGINAAASEMNFPSTLIPVFKTLLKIEQAGGQVFFDEPGRRGDAASDFGADGCDSVAPAGKDSEADRVLAAQRILAPTPEALASIAKEQVLPHIVKGRVTGFRDLGDKIAILLENDTPFVMDG